MKRSIMVLIALIIGVLAVFENRLWGLAHDFRQKLRADVRAADADERMAAALDRAYPAAAQQAQTLPTLGGIVVESDLKDAVAAPLPVAVKALYLPLPGYNH